MKKLLLFGLGGCALFTVGILIGHFAIQQSDTDTSPVWVPEISQDVDESFIEKFIAEVDNMEIERNLKELTKVPHMATTKGDEETVQYVLKRWQDPTSGLDQAWREEYLVHLSFPDKNQKNSVKVDATLLLVTEREKNYTSDQNDPEVVQPYAAYSPAGHAKGKLIYANQGKTSDYEHLNNTLNLTGTIAIVRYGGAGRGAKAINAAPFGVIGVLVYTDPGDINDGLMSDLNETYPHSWYLPPSGVERGSYNSQFGDLLTPYLAAKQDTYRIPKETITGLPPIPTQPIGFEDAFKLICELGGEPSPESWHGGFNCTYNVGGPGFRASSIFNNSDVKMDIYNKEELKNSSNVMGVIRGSVEPDRYVIYGNHRDSWVHGAIDPSSGTAVMLEITRVLGKMVKEGKWRPRRSIIFGSWGAEEFGLIGSAEYTEEYYTKLFERSVAYINVDISVFGRYAFHSSVYDNWLQYFNRSSPTYGLIPNVGHLTGAGSDYAAFIHFLGITSMDISYTYDRSKTKARIYPAYHTAYDTFDYASKFIDPGFTSHQTVARTAGNVLLRLADSLLLPFNCSDYAESLEQYLQVALDNFQEELSKHGISMDPLKSAVLKFRLAATNLDRVIHQSDFAKETPYKIRRINDQLMLLDRAFLDPMAFPDKYAYRHVIWASRSSGLATFPGLADAFEGAKNSGLKQDWSKAHKHLSIVAQAIAGAASTLEEVI
uniref:Aminopeptidase NAALADL1 n=1 Tax=Denticeps clupeoides TaxID=299321 RepID=A0AAY4ATE7_9TELE